MTNHSFDAYFQGEARQFLLRAIDLALDEDGPDLTSEAVFPDHADVLRARILTRQRTIVAGLPIVPLVLDRLECEGCWSVSTAVEEGARVEADTEVAVLTGPAALLLRAERTILNFVCHLSGVANMVDRHVQALEGSRTRLLDTRKTLPGLRYPEKYAVLLGGGANHRRNLSELLMLKDNHIDRAGSIARAVERLRAAHSPCPPIEVECRTLDEVRQAVAQDVDRIMLDNMGPERIRQALELIPAPIETEISGGVGLDNIAALGSLGADYISVGRVTHSAPAADFTMLMAPRDPS